MPKTTKPTIAVAALFLSSLPTAAVRRAQAAPPPLPTPCAAAACGPSGPSKLVTAGAATAVYSGRSLTVNQTTSSAILNWSSFSIAAGNSVAFKQPSTSSVALNRIFEANPSQVFGSLSANGQVYLVNPNGFVFGKGSTVNVGGLLASSLPLALSDKDFANGILAPLQSNNPVLAAKVGNTSFDPLDPKGLNPNGRTVVLDMNGTPVLDSNGQPLPVQVVVQPGATLNAASQGRIFLAGQQVTNGGTITAPDGQVVLAAGTRVFLQASTDPSLRGLVVEVDSNTDPKVTNTAWNQLTGSLSAARGNVTLVGLAVNQDGRISATTSVSANGSIRLEAATTGPTPAFGSVNTTTTVSSTKGGTLSLGPQSEMDILPELSSSATAVQADVQPQSSVTLLGEQVLLQGGSITAPNGLLTAVAAGDPSPAAAKPDVGVGTSGLDPNARLRIEAGTRIDLSGSDATLPVTANLVSAQLRGNEFADDPTQRNGALRGLTVYFDQRTAPASSFANLSGEIGAIPHSIAERTEKGGKAVFQSENDVIFAPGASINVSGGTTTYTGAVMQTTELVGANGQLYPIATANPLLTYVGVVNPTFSQTYNKWGVQDILPTPGLSTYQPGYVQGASAGSVQFAAPSLVLQGQLTGTAVSGPYQRTPSTAAVGGQLTIGLPGGVGVPPVLPPYDYLAPAVRITTTPSPVVASDNASVPPGLTLEMPAAYLTSSGFTATRIFSDGDVTLPAGLPLQLPGGSTLAVTAARVDLLSNITDPGGSLNFQNSFNVGSANAAVGSGVRPGVYVGDDVTLDVRGRWTNDTPGIGANPTAQTWQNGGTITVAVNSPGAQLSLGSGVDFRASGGAWMTAAGTITAGTGGAITVSDAALGGAFAIGSGFAADGFGANGAAGGAFSLSAPRVDVVGGNGSGNWISAQRIDDSVPSGSVLQEGGVLKVTTDLFSEFGFQKMGLNASGLVAAKAPTANVMTVEPGTAIDATVNTLVLDPQTAMRGSAASLDGLAAAQLLAPYQRQPASLTLSAVPPASGSNTGTGGPGTTSIGDVWIGKGASISTGPCLSTSNCGAIALNGLGSIEVDGALNAPGGNATLHIVAPGNYDAGFQPTQAIHLSSSGSIDVAGATVSIPSNAGLNLGAIYAGGSVSLLTDRGAVVTDSGSRISVAGTSAPLDAQQPDGSYRAVVASTAAGSVTVQSGQSISLLGDIDGHGGASGSLGSAAAGTLTLALARNDSSYGWAPSASPTFNNAPLTVQIVGSGLGVSQSPFNGNVAVLSSTTLGTWGIDALNLEADSLVQFVGSPTLNLARSFIVNSPAVGAYFGANANVSAPYVQIGNPVVTSVAPPAAQGGTGTLSFAGAEIDLVGTTVFQGTSNVRLASSGDLLLRGLGGQSPNALTGGVTVDGSLVLSAERLFPVTETTFGVSALPDPLQDVPGSLTINQAGVNPGVPLSAAGNLTFTTDTFTNDGTVYAPFGTISVNASKSVTLGSSSLTSVSGAGTLIPLGVTVFGRTEWDYLKLGDQTVTVIGAVPARAVNLTAPSVTLAKGATIDLTGGGDLFASEFAPGTGGSVDVLAPTTAAASSTVSGLYAVIPSLVGQAAPQDPLFDVKSGLQPGLDIYLSGGGGIAAGYYPLLPARYALVPGAYLIRTQPQVQTSQGGGIASMGDGTPVVAGFLTYGTTGLHQTPGYIGVAVYQNKSIGLGADGLGGSYASQLAEYDFSTASSYFAAAAATAGKPRPTLPVDAGSLTFNVLSALDVAGTVHTAADKGGLGAAISISANDLVVGNASASQPADAVDISGSVISGWNAGSLILGGTKSTLSDGTPALDVVANSVTVQSGSTLAANEVILTALQSVDVQSGAVVQTTSAATGTAPAKAPAQQAIAMVNCTTNTCAPTTITPTVPATAPGGPTPALLAVSDTNWLVPSNLSSGTYTGTATVTVEPGGTVSTRGAVSIDGVGGVAVKGTASGPGAEWSLGSSSLAIASNDATSADTLTVGSNLLTQLAAGSAVSLASAGAIDLLSPVRFGVDASGHPTLNALTLTASSLNDLTGSAGGSSEFGGQTLSLQGSGVSAAIPAPGATTAQLTLVGGQVDLGPNVLTVNGFGNTNVNAGGAIVGQKSGGLSVGGDLHLTAGAVAPGTGGSTAITAGGALDVASNGSAGKPDSLGGQLSLTGATVDIAGVVTAPAGRVVVSSTGDITLDKGAIVSAPGALVTIQNQSAGTPGGSVSITAGGNLTLNPGATLDVSGAGSAAGGSLAMTAAGSARIGATLIGTGGGGAPGGRFTVDAVTLATPLDTLAALLTTGGFTGAIDVRARTGDLTSSATLSANAITLAADAGRIDVSGALTAASGALRGSISLFGGDGIEIHPGAALSADGIGTFGRGGTIELAAGRLVADQNGVLDAYSPATLSLDAGSRLSTAGAAGNGTVLLRAPALTATNDVAISSLASDLAGVGRLVVEPVLAFNTSDPALFSSANAPTATDFANVQQSLSNYMTAAASGIGARLGANSATPVVIQPGAEVIASGDLLLPGLDLAPTAGGTNWRFGPNATSADLTVRAAGTIEVGGTLTDGFDQQIVGAKAVPVLLASSSSSIRLVAGADLTGANPLDVNANRTGDLNIDPGAVVRTGTGDLDLVAGGSISVGSGGGAYTAGTIAIQPGQSAATPYVVPASQPKAVGTATPWGILTAKPGTLISFPTGGGNLLVRAGGDIDATGLPPDAGVPTWQTREGGKVIGNTVVLPVWGVNLEKYDWSFGTLGGGDVVVAAGGNASYLTVAAAGSLLPQYTGTQYVRSGGLSFTAGGDIGTAEVYLADGTGSVRAGGALTAIASPTNPGAANIGSAFYLQSGTLDVNARLGIALDGVFNPTALTQATTVSAAQQGSFLSYGGDSALRLQSVTGDILAGLGDGGVAAATLLGSLVSEGGGGGEGASALPASVTVQALNGSIEFGQSLAQGRGVLYPSATGQVDLLAAQNIENASLVMSDAVSGTYAATSTPTGQTLIGNAAFVGDLHSGDAAPVLMTAGNDVSNVNLSIPKTATITAGRDIFDLTYFGQNLNPGDRTLLTAGRDVVYDQNAGGAFVSVGGPGALDVLAGRNVTLGFSQGITTNGNLVNPNLATAQGATVTVLTGLGTALDVPDFLAKVVAPSKGSATDYTTQLETFVEAAQGSSGLSLAQAETGFQSLRTDQQLPFLDSVFFNELLLSGREANATPSLGFTRGYAAIDALFPHSRSAGPNPVADAYAGDLTLSFSQIYTLSGGDITLLVPGGGINVGLAVVPPLLSSRAPSTLGIVAEGPGNVDIYTKNDIQVNASRIFTLGGGNVLIWSNEGSIDAGKGAKTSVSAPPPTISFNSNGTVSLSFAGAAVGSGIRTIQTDPNAPAGNVDLIAPIGTVNAGDAGIGAAGNINIAARSVIGASNINFGGSASGVPAAISSIGASLSAASSSGSGASNAAANSVASNAAEKEAAAPLAQNALSWLDVFVTGLGEENCDPKDIECLKRQKTPAH